MGNTASVSFTDDDEEVWNWIEDKYKNGPFRSRSHVIVWACEQAMHSSDDNDMLT